MLGTLAAQSLACAALCACVVLAQTEGTLDEQAVNLIQSKCASCHGAARMSDLDVRQRETMLKGGRRGPAIDPGKPESSLLFQAAAHQGDLKMPPGSKAPLPAADLKVLRNWIEAGAQWPASSQTLKRPASTWWSFQPVQRPAIPQAATSAASRSPIDAFINAKLAQKGLRPAPKADKITLLRRVYEDLIGLPPSPGQVASFLADTSPDAFEKVVDELLASPHYGERWGRQWLDVVRYADSAGFEGDVYYPNAWRYRDYVIKSFNEDKPYDRFVQEQIAGDELWPDDLDLGGFYDVAPEKLEHLEARIGTGLYTFGPEIQESYLDSPKLRYERLTDWVDTTGAAFLGLTLGCARCHDHKFDPISQADYYGMQAIFAASKPILTPVVTGLSATHRDEYYHTQLAIQEARAAYRLMERKVRERVLAELKKQYSTDVVQAFELPADKRSPAQAGLAAPLVKAANGIKMEEHFTPEEQKQHEELAKRIVQSVLDVPETDPSHRVRFDGFFDLPVATVLGHVDPENVPEVYVLKRGDLGKNKAKAEPGLPSVLAGDDSALVSDGYGPRYRKSLALWLTRPDHPLTARVMVNRIWQGHFGRGLVATANDFGSQGSPPSHPELLDWLASELVARDWSLKSLHRLILLSETYQRTSRFTDATDASLDPENAYLWRMNRRRLDAESLWDAIHAVSGTLNLKMRGRPVIPPLTSAEMLPMRIKSWWVTPADPSEANRRAVYILTRRNFTFPLFDRFDRPDSSASCPVREVTTVAPQALWGMNNRIAYEQASQFAARLKREVGDQPAEWIRAAWRLALARDATEVEIQESQLLVDRLASSPGGSRVEALNQLCLSLFNLSEFEYID